MKMIRYSAAFVTALFVLSPLAWVASGFQPSQSFNPCQRETATTMTSTKTTPEVMISRRLVLDTSVVGGIVAAASLVANPPPCRRRLLSQQEALHPPGQADTAAAAAAAAALAVSIARTTTGHHPGGLVFVGASTGHCFRANVADVRWGIN